MAAPRESLLKICAWLIHLYTAIGAVVALIALYFIEQGAFRTVFSLMALALIIDSTDGPLARAVAIRRRVPVFDGATLDNIVDYLNYVLIPAMLMIRAGILLAGAAGLASASFMVLASAYGFCRVDAKTVDHYFRGFPSYWNIAAFYLYCLGWPAWINTIIIVVLALTVFLPLKFIYPNRTIRMRALTLALGAVWAAAAIALLIELPRVNSILLYTSLVYIVYYFAMSAVLQATEPVSIRP
jgi:phosphatidylcholine synthase